MLVSSVLLSRNAWSDEGKGEHAHDEKHEHEMPKIGDIGFLKMTADNKKGAITVELLKTDKKTVLVIEGDLKLNVTQGKEKKDFTLKIKEGTTTYEVTDKFFIGEKPFESRFVLKSDAKQYVVKIEAHGHKEKEEHKH